MLTDPLLSETPAQCVHAYAGTASTLVNDVLAGRRVASDQRQEAYIAHMTSSIDLEMSASGMSFVVWRGMNSACPAPVIGETVLTAHYLSTSLLREVAEEFAWTGTHRPKLWRIEVGPQVRFVDVAANTCRLHLDSENLLVRREQEILLQRALPLQVIRVDDSSETILIHARAAAGAHAV